MVFFFYALTVLDGGLSCSSPLKSNILENSPQRAFHNGSLLGELVMEESRSQEFSKAKMQDRVMLRRKQKVAALMALASFHSRSITFAAKNAGGLYKILV